MVRRMRVGEPREEQIKELRVLWKEAFGDTDEFLDDFYNTALARERCRCVTIDGEVVAALYWFECDVKDMAVDNAMADARAVAQGDLQAASTIISQAASSEGKVSWKALSEKPNHLNAYIYAVATAKKFQGQGICHKLMKDTHNHLKECGYEGAILVPGSEGLFRFYEGMGYKTCSYIREFHCEGELQNISFKQIDKLRYGVLRRQYLPESGVIQEGVNLDFLETQAKFYAGEDFLLAACRDGDRLRGVELLGNEKAAAGMVHALGYNEGYFRCQAICRREGPADVHFEVANACRKSCLWQVFSVSGMKEWCVMDDRYVRSVPFGMYHPLVADAIVPEYFGLAFD